MPVTKLEILPEHDFIKNTIKFLLKEFENKKQVAYIDFIRNNINIENLNLNNLSKEAVHEKLEEKIKNKKILEYIKCMGGQCLPLELMMFVCCNIRTLLPTGQLGKFSKSPLNSNLWREISPNHYCFHLNQAFQMAQGILENLEITLQALKISQDQHQFESLNENELNKINTQTEEITFEEEDFTALPTHIAPIILDCEFDVKTNSNNELEISISSLNLYLQGPLRCSPGFTQTQLEEMQTVVTLDYLQKFPPKNIKYSLLSESAYSSEMNSRIAPLRSQNPELNTNPQEPTGFWWYLDYFRIYPKAEIKKIENNINNKKGKLEPKTKFTS